MMVYLRLKMVAYMSAILFSVSQLRGLYAIMVDSKLVKQIALILNKLRNPLPPCPTLSGHLETTLKCNSHLSTPAPSFCLWQLQCTSLEGFYFWIIADVSRLACKDMLFALMNEENCFVHKCVNFILQIQAFICTNILLVYNFNINVKTIIKLQIC